jgi:hypothetical protein
MGKIINQSLEEKSIPNSIDELELSFQAEVRSDDLEIPADGLMPSYDDEIGLWEELESRYRRRAQMQK